MAVGPARPGAPPLDPAGAERPRAPESEAVASKLAAQGGAPWSHGTVAVTGASGYIATWLVRYLLEACATVHATVRDPENHEKTAPLRALAAAHPGRLRLFAADLLDPAGFDAAFAGCTTLFHTASPFTLDQSAGAAERFIAPAVEGTRHVLAAATHAATISRVVLTSSVAAISGDARECTARGGTLTEAHWNETSRPDHNPYACSKTRAERAAWEIATTAPWRLVALNPGLVLGPSLSPASRSGSFALIGKYTNGSLLFGVPEIWLGCVDVRDVARAHIAAAQNPGATGRHILVAETLTMLELGQRLRALFGPFHPYPRTTLPKSLLRVIGPLMGVTRDFIDANVGWPLAYDNTRARQELGLAFTPLDTTLRDQFSA